MGTTWWIDQDSGEHSEASDEETKLLEDLLESGKETRIDDCLYEQVYFVERERFITASLTEDDAKEHLRLNGHNIPGAYIYVTSLYRTPGMIRLRNSLPALISTAREVSRLREAWDWAVSFLEDMGMDPDHPDLEKWKERLDPYPSGKSEGPSSTCQTKLPQHPDAPPV